jgi:hypothetical protein
MVCVEYTLMEPLEKRDGFMIDNEDISRDIDPLTDQVRPLHDSPLTTVA